MELSDTYIQSFIQPRNDLLLEMEAYAIEHHVPIMQLAAIDALNQLLRIQKPQSILEIGTAIGYSAMRIGTTEQLWWSKMSEILQPMKKQASTTEFIMCFTEQYPR